MGFKQIVVRLESFWGEDRNVAEQAWASSTDFDKLSRRSDEEVRRMAQDVVIKAHDTPKERAWFDFFITCPIFVERQFDKYRMSTQIQDVQIDYNMAEFGRHGITQNELSGRYRIIPERYYELPDDVERIIKRAYSVQSSFGPNPDYHREDYASSQQAAFDAYSEAVNDLKRARDRGAITTQEYRRARDVYRGLLPLSTLTDMRIVCNGNALEWILNQRLKDDAQEEAQVVAYGMFKVVAQAKAFPVMIDQMSRTNGWSDSIVRIENMVETC